MSRRMNLIARWLVSLALALGGWFVASARPVHAASITVNTFIEGNSSDGFCSLREAVQSANLDSAIDSCTAGSGADTITLLAGTYVLSTGSANEDAAAGGDLDILDDLTIIGSGAATTIITTTVVDRIFHVISPTVVIQNLTISGGNSGSNGGGLFNNGGTVSLINVTLTNNFSDGGGGIFSQNGNTTVLSSTVSNNNAQSSLGGGIYFNTGVLTVSNSTISNNTAPTGGGGLYMASGQGTLNTTTVSGNSESGLTVSSDASLDITDSTISGNTAGGGGGISTNGTVTLTRSLLSNNTATTGNNGGAISASPGSVTTIISSTLSGNSAPSSDGGAIATFSNGSTLIVDIMDSTLSGNSAVNGGALAIAGLATTTVKVINSTLSGNTSTASGGAIYIRHTLPTLKIYNSTIAYNTADSDLNSNGFGGGLRVDGGAVTVTNSILADNLGSGGTASDCSSNGGTFVSTGHNLFGALCTGVGTDLSGSALLGPLQDNGGPTFTRAPQAASPVLDAGDPSGCKNQNGVTLTTDQRGFLRPVGGACDIGAFERGTANLAVSLKDIVDPVTAGNQLTYTVVMTNFGPHPATGVVLTDVLPGNVILIAATASQGTCASSGASITCTVGTLALNATTDLTLTVTPLTSGNIANTVFVSSNEADPTPANNSASEATTVNSAPDISLVMTDAPDPAISGLPLTYTLNVLNGSSLASNVRLTDTLPLNVSFKSVATTAGSCSGSGPVLCNLGSLAANTVVTITVVVTPTTTGTLTNSATLSGSPDVNASNNQASQTTTVNAEADLALEMTAAPTPAKVNTAVTYTLAVTNNGPSLATNVILTDTLPSNVTFKSASAGCALNISKVVCLLANLPRDATLSITLVVTAPSSLSAFNNTALVTAQANDPQMTDNNASYNTFPVADVDLVMSLVANPAPVTFGSALSYTVLITNTDSTFESSGTVLTATLPAAVTFSEIDYGSCTASTLLFCSLSTISPATTITVTLTFTPTRGGVFSQMLYLFGDNPDPLPLNSTVTVTLTAIGFNLYLPLIAR